MHEYSLVAALVDRVEAEARARHATAVRGVSLRVGELSGVEPALLLSAYEIYRPGTIVAGAPLQIATVTARWECPACARSLPRGSVLRCPECGQEARLAEGGELLLERIEMEVP